MRDYVKGYYGEFHEDNNGLGIHLVLKVWRADINDFWSTIDQLKADVAAAGAGWTGTLALSAPRWWKFGQGDIQTILETWWHGTSQAGNAFTLAMEAQLLNETPRSDGYNSITEED